MKLTRCDSVGYAVITTNAMFSSASSASPLKANLLFFLIHLLI
jgi:hypothetical protein